MRMCIVCTRVRCVCDLKRSEKETEHTDACAINELTLRVLTLKLNPKYAQAYGKIETERYQWANDRMNAYEPILPIELNHMNILACAIHSTKCVQLNRMD